MELVLIISFIITLIVLGGTGIGSAIDDLRSVRRQQAFRAHRHARQYRARPLVTALLDTDSSNVITNDALENLLKSSYRRLEIVLIGKKSQRRGLNKIARRLTRSSRPIHVYTGDGATDAAFRRYGHGKIIISLDSHDRLDPQAIGRAVWHFSAQPHIVKLQTSTLIDVHYGSVGLLQTYANAFAHFWNKFGNVVTDLPRLGMLTVSFYRSEAYLAQQTHRTVTAYFAEDVISHRPAGMIHYSQPRTLTAHFAQTYRILWSAPARLSVVRWSRRLLAVCLVYLFITLPYLLSYTVYLALVPHQPMPLLGSAAGIGTGILLGVWSQPGRSLMQKIRLSLGIPMCLLPFYVASFVVAALTLFTYAHITIMHISRVMRDIKNTARPLKMLTNMGEAVIPRRVSLFLRIKNVLRIIKVFYFAHIAKD